MAAQPVTNMTIEKLRELNPNINVFSIKDKEFSKYGRIIELDTQEICDASKKLKLPETGSEYIASVDSLEKLTCAEKIYELTAGGCDAQIGICHGHSRSLNGLEYHKSSEINIAVTPLVLLLGLVYEMDGNEYQSDRVKAFYLEAGDVVEIYSTTLHFCPCQVSDEGFSCVVALPRHTNELLSKKASDRLLFKKNKWLICHEDNTGLINRGAYPGIHGINYSINY